jgi:hypothetical protein
MDTRDTASSERDALKATIEDVPKLIRGLLMPTHWSTREASGLVQVHGSFYAADHPDAD